MKKFGVEKAKLVSVYSLIGTVENVCDFDTFTQVVSNVIDFDYEEDCSNQMLDRYVLLESGTKVREFDAAEAIN